MKKFSDIYDECIPLKKCTSKYKRDPLSPWITKGILKSINTKNKLYKQYLQCPNDIRRQKFVTFRNKLHTIIRKSKRPFFFSKFQYAKGNMKETWKTINNVIGRGQRRALSKQF